MAVSHDAWHLAPCGLLEIDQDGTVTRANARFLALTGYTTGDLAGQLLWTNLLTAAGRIFYETQLAPMLALNGSVEELLLDVVCADGRRLPALVTAERVRTASAPEGEVTRVALMSVPDRQQYERQLRDAWRQAELVADANSALASSLDVRAALSGLAGVLVGDLADWCLVYAVDPDKPRELPHWAAAHVDSGQQADLDRLARLLPAHATADSVLGKVLNGADPILLAQLTLDDLPRLTSSDEVIELIAQMGLQSALVVPSVARAQQAAVLVLVRGPGRPPFTAEILAEVADLAQRTGIAIDNLRLYAREHSISVALQKALLTPLPSQRGLQLASRYTPGTNGSEIGGDWYDAFRQPDGTTVVVVGDVVGHDINAAAAMGHLRGVIRTIGHTTSGTPAQTLARADRAAAGLQVQVIASAVLAALRERSRDVFTLHWSCAGHPPPVLVRRSGEVEVLDGGSDVLLGVFPDRERRQFELEMRHGDTLVLYTDGLIERRDEDIADSIAKLAAHLAFSADLSLDELCERALQQRPPGTTDDVALLAVRVGRGPRGTDR